MKNLKHWVVAFFAMFLMLVGVDAFATSDYDTLTAAVDFTALKTAFGVVFAAFIAVGIFIKGGGKIAGKLGFK
ncbi:hypothetical protein [Methylomonas sp. TEB]|uniref:hypothetical protein n=1 Tax=Methylomonas sp. TEB TaxID=3398229 RepID=UPI0039F5BC53